MLVNIVNQKSRKIESHFEISRLSFSTCSIISRKNINILPGDTSLLDISVLFYFTGPEEKCYRQLTTCTS